MTAAIFENKCCTGSQYEKHQQPVLEDITKA